MMNLKNKQKKFSFSKLFAIILAVILFISFFALLFNKIDAIVFWGLLLFSFIYGKLFFKKAPQP